MRAMKSLLVLGAVGLALSGCASVLPKAQNEVTSPWTTFEDARGAIERIEPHRTTAADLRAQGLDPYSTPNVQLLTYSDIVLRFPLGGSIAPEHLDTGLRECLQAGKACTGYAIAAKNVHRDRVGNYWQDAFGFKRTIDTSGWNFNALILLVEDRVVYTLYGGQPQLREHEVSRQPLGPLQEWGRAIPMPQPW